ncbi:hypothetical protein ZOSMA_69G00140 [Zostera marina]|uniref:Uncharacterized protein n=1 Tax=Zostera marina TaxID=29655 RepID=A0A0K9NRU2_ZOSMR|nr:hypothetical protein ZOSMA_69G00140 [Zostera marina]
MNRRFGNAKVEERMQLNKFLRPGALARMRDSRMIRSRSPKSTTKFASLPISSSSSEENRAGVVVVPQVADLDRLSRFFAARTSGPRFVQRKKLLASKEIIFKNPSVVVAVGMDGVDAGLTSDFLLAH